MENYINYNLYVTQQSHIYELRADCSLVGQVTDQIADELTSIGSWSSELQTTPKEIGQCLYETIFRGRIGKHFSACLAAARAGGQGLRIRLHLGNNPLLVRLPWEYLYDPYRENFFALSIHTPIVRYLDVLANESPMRMEEPIHILVVLADPIDIEPRLDVEREWAQLQTAFQDLEMTKRVKLHCLPRATKLEIQHYLRRNRVDVFHFIGHGYFDPQVEKGLLVIEDHENRAEMVSAEVLACLLKDRMPSLVYLNSCNTAQTGIHDPLTGTAQELVQQGVPAVIAMQAEIHDERAIQIAHEFYLALIDGYPVDAALVEGRKAVFGMNEQIEWGTPVLFMRSSDGNIFVKSRERLL